MGSAENTAEEDNKYETTEDESKPVVSKREGTPQLHIEEAAAEIIDKNISVKDSSQPEETDISCLQNDVDVEKERKVNDSYSLKTAKQTKNSENSGKDDKSKILSPKSNTMKNAETKISSEKEENKNLSGPCRRKG